MLQFWRDFIQSIRSQRTERDHRTLAMYHKVPLKPNLTWPAAAHYAKLLNAEPFKKVVQQESLVDKVTLELDDELVVGDDLTATASSSEGFLNVTCFSCECTFWTGMNLPCRHIFALRRHVKCNEFDALLCNDRWTRSRLQERHRIFQEGSIPESQVSVITTPRASRVMSERTKYNAAASVTMRLNKILAKIPSTEFPHHLQVLEKIADIWDKGGHVQAVEVVCSDDIVPADNLDSGSVEELATLTVGIPPPVLPEPVTPAPVRPIPVSTPVAEPPTSPVLPEPVTPAPVRPIPVSTPVAEPPASPVLAELPPTTPSLAEVVWPERRTRRGLAAMATTSTTSSRVVVFNPSTPVVTSGMTLPASAPTESSTPSWALPPPLRETDPAPSAPSPPTDILTLPGGSGATGTPTSNAPIPSGSGARPKTQSATPQDLRGSGARPKTRGATQPDFSSTSTTGHTPPTSVVQGSTQASLPQGTQASHIKVITINTPPHTTIARKYPNKHMY